MKKSPFNLLLIAICLYCIPFKAMAQYKLQDYIEEALKNNLELRNQDFMFQKSIYALKEARGLFLPQVEMSTQYLSSEGGRKIEIPIGDLLNPVYSTLNNLTSSGRFPQVENVSQAFNPNNYYDAKVRTTLSLYNAEITYNSRIKKEQINLRQAQLMVYKRELVKNVKLAYYGYQQSLQSVKVLENGVALANENLRINQSLVKNGKAIRTVISRAQNELTGLEAQLENARLQSVNAAAYFNFLLNKPLQSAIDAGEPDSSTLPADTLGTRKREELQVLESAEKVTALALKMNNSYVLPKLSTFIDLGAQGDFLKVNAESPYYLFGVTLSWSIFTGNQYKNKSHQAALELRSAQNQTSQARQQLQLEAETARNKLIGALQAHKAAVSQTSMSQQYFKDEQRLYKEGQALYLELLDGQIRLINDELKQTMALLEVRSKQAELERAEASYIF
ncbi:TolC family protein [Pedobacter sp. AW31-3R]|uniref:TolC family protein n=1 Tax=Pedobacter sp. AW31-3R TaxID=3445781 RepID=UPI003FA037DB